MTTRDVMKTIMSGEEMLLIAAEEYLKKLTTKHDKAKARMSAYNDSMPRIIEIRNKGLALAKSSVNGSLEDLKKNQAEISALAKEEQRLLKLLNQDYMKLSDAEFKTLMEVEQFTIEVDRLKFRVHARRRI